MGREADFSKNKDTFLIDLTCTFVLAFIAMEFVNVFIGRIGGIPVFAGFFVAYYLMHYKISAKKVMEILPKRILLMYMSIYTAVWALITVVMFMSIYTGWGNVKKLKVGEFFKGLYGTSLSETWEYIFAIILMLTFIASLFPLCIMNLRSCGRNYLVCDVLNWAVILLIVEFIDKNVINHKNMLQAGAMMLFAMCLLVGELCVICRVTSKDSSYIESENKRLYKLFRRLSTRTIISIAVTVSVVLVIAILYFFSPTDESGRYSKVAECLTEDYVMGPMIYNNTVYIPININMDYHKSGEPAGYIVYKNQNYNSKFYELTSSNLLYTDKKEEATYVQMYGVDNVSYKRLSVIEKANSWKDEKVFLMWDEEWERESSYNKDVTGFTECDRAFVSELESTFGEVELVVADFKDYDAYFTIAGYKSLKDAVEDEGRTGTWVGCILVKDDKFYYGNYENEITGVLLQKLRHIIGGN